MAIETYETRSGEGRGRILKGHTKAVNVGARTATGLASTLQVDMDGEIVLPSAFSQTLPAFLAGSAPFLGCHVHRSADGAPTQIGWVTAAQVRDLDVAVTLRYALTDAGEEWWRLASDPNGRGHALSIGFWPLRQVSGTVADLVAAMPEIADAVRAAGLVGDDRLTVHTEIDLLEISAVPVGSNRQSLLELALRAFSREDGQGGQAGEADEAERLTGALARAVGLALAEAGLTGGERIDAESIRRLQAALDDAASRIETMTELMLGPDWINPQAHPDATADRVGGAGDPDPAQSAVVAAARDLKQQAGR